MQKELGKSLKKQIKGIDIKEVEDIFIFGSAVKGKEFPNDIDLCVVFKRNIINEVINNIEKKLKGSNVHISLLVVDNFFKRPQPLIKTLLLEGISIFDNTPFSERFGFLSYAIYSYDISKLKPSEKVKFVYLLKGRKSEGIIKKMGGEWMADSCFIIPIKKDSEMQIILKKWQVPFKRKEALIH